MAELTTGERLQPALLDRLRDDEPQAKSESRERRVMSMRQLREAVLRDLSWLMNTPSKPDFDEIHQFPLVAKSVVNYGILDFTGLSVETLRSVRLEYVVKEAIEAFEPRIMKMGLQVRAVENKRESQPTLVAFEISGDMCPLPMPEALFVRTELDLDTGQCELKERG